MGQVHNRQLPNGARDNYGEHARRDQTGWEETFWQDFEITTFTPDDHSKKANDNTTGNKSVTIEEHPISITSLQSYSDEQEAHKKELKEEGQAKCGEAGDTATQLKGGEETKATTSSNTLVTIEEIPIHILREQELQRQNDILRRKVAQLEKRELKLEEQLQDVITDVEQSRLRNVEKTTVTHSLASIEYPDESMRTDHVASLQREIDAMRGRLIDLEENEKELLKQLQEANDDGDEARESNVDMTNVKHSSLAIEDPDEAMRTDQFARLQRENDALRRRLIDSEANEKALLKQLLKANDDGDEARKSLRKKESESKKQIEGLKKERDDKQNKLRQSEKQIIKLKESLSKKDSESKKQIEALRRERDDKQNQLRQSEGQITERKDYESRKVIETLTKEKDDKQNQLRQSVDQIAKLKESLNNMESDSRKQTEALKKERDDIRNQLRESKDQITKQKESLCQQVKTKDDSIKSLQEEMDHVTDVLRAAQEEVAGFNNQIASLQEELEKHDAVMQENRQLMVALNEKEMVLRVAEDAKEDALRRLSQRDNNPNIVDLSDVYRPSKLAEMMCELYDNQWWDAFDYLEDNWEHGKTFSETKCIEFLLNVLMEIYTFCLSKITNDWTDGLSKILLTKGPNNETEMIWALQGIRKKNILTQLPTYEKMCVVVLINMEHSRDSSFSKHLLQDKLYEYLQECVKLCLLMAVQDPPVCLVCEGWKTRQTIKGENSCLPADSTNDIIQNGTVEKRKEFDRGSYKEYTKRGQYIEYIVWPLIYLHENGPILCKGVAQACDTSTIPPHDNV